MGEIWDRVETLKIAGFAEPRQVFFKTAPSGAEYGLRKLTFGEGRDIKIETAEKIKVKAKRNSQQNAEAADNEGEMSMDASALISQKYKVLQKCLVKVPWRDVVGAVDRKELDDKTPIEDSDALLEFTDQLNFPPKEQLEKSAGS